MAESATPTAADSVSGVDATLADSAPTVDTLGAARPARHHGTLALGATLASQPGESAPTATDGRPLVPTAVRSTVLPRVEIVDDRPTVVADGRPRYESMRSLGAGGVGEVTLTRDHDIRRDVAIKRLHPEQSTQATLLRFAEEVRTIGRLEHPNIVPVHDVGIDESGQHYFVMKYVQGETLEAIIEKLAAGDPACLAQYTYEYRVEVFKGVLRAIQYAHARGIIHRDIKPSNVMVGPYGEVMVMDWGLAKRIRDTAGETTDVDALAANDATAPDAAVSSERERLFRTRHGTLLGTPAYMSPEQARGAHDEIDERSDVYSLCVMFLELLTLRHYLADRTTVTAMLAGVMEHDHTVDAAVEDHARTAAPIELLYFVQQGMRGDRAERFTSIDAMLAALHAIDDGRIPVQCPITLLKRGGTESGKLLDRFPRSGMVAAAVAAALVLFGLGDMVYRIVH